MLLYVYKYILIFKTMKKYKIFHSSRFDTELSKFDSFFQSQVDKIEDKLLENPYSGDPINVRWFREKKIGKYRIYYLIYEDLESIFMVAISEKKDQQKVIDTIKMFLDIFKEELKNLVDK